MPIYTGSMHATHSLFILKVPVPEDTRSQRRYEDVEEEEYEEEVSSVSRVHYNDHMVYSE